MAVQSLVSSHLALWYLARRVLKLRAARSWLTALSVAVVAASLTTFLALAAANTTSSAA